jgi:hypothetical protein
MRQLFLVECYSNGGGHADALAESERLRSATLRERDDGGQAIDYVGSIRVPKDEVVFHLVRSASAADVDAVCRLGGIVSERIVESVLLNLELVGPTARARDRRSRLRAAATRR